MKYNSFFEATQYIESLIQTGSKYKFPAGLGLRRMKYLLNQLDNPQDSFKSIHIAGTSGKGSTAYLISQILFENGYKVGLHMSPHLQTIRERLIINNELISEYKFTELVNEVEPHIANTSAAFESPVTYFEALLALVFLYFKKEKIEIGVIETGLGGTYDGTNILHSFITVITKIGFDHMAILGNTIKEIASQKAGIIKSQNICCISHAQLPDAEKILLQTTNNLKVPLLMQGRDFRISQQHLAVDKTSFTYSDSQNMLKDISLPLIGQHQIENCATAIQTVLALHKTGMQISNDKIISALKKAHFPGRIEREIIDGQEWILDGAHNEDKLTATISTLQKIYPNKEKVAIIGFKQDKDLETCLKILAPHFKMILCTQSKALTDMGRHMAATPESLKEIVEKIGYKGTVKTYYELNDAINYAKALNNNYINVITGSLYLVGEARTYLGLKLKL